MDRVFLGGVGVVNLWFADDSAFFLAHLESSPAGPGHVLFQVGPGEGRVLYTDIDGGEKALADHLGAHAVHRARFQWQASEAQLFAEVHGQDGRHYQFALEFKSTLATQLFELAMQVIPQAWRDSLGFIQRLQKVVDAGLGRLLGAGEGARMYGIYTDGVLTWDPVYRLKLVKSGRAQADGLDLGRPVLSPRGTYHGELAWPRGAPGLLVEFQRIRRT